MDFVVRPATKGDVSAISAWTRDTFEWGDYVPDRLPVWLDDDASLVVVCTVDEVPVSVMHTVMLSETEAWLEAARVHPEHKRAGMGKAMNAAGVEWASARGALVARLATETGNAAAMRQVEALGYRPTSTWLHSRVPTPPRPVGGRTSSLELAASNDVDAAWMYWSGTDLNFDGRALIAHGWQWRKARPADLFEAAEAGTLYQSADGWAVVEQPDNAWIRVSWLATSRSQAPGLLLGLGELGRRLGVDELSLKIPNVDWAAEALLRSGFEDTSEVVIHSLSL